MKPGAILASNTSTLDVDKIAAFTKRPQDVVGMHFFSPANVMKLLEVVRGAKTAKDVLATVMALAKKIKKTAVVSGVCDGFIGNRMIEQYSRQAGFLLDEGCTPAQVDKAIEKFGFAMGPFRMGDLAGNDIGWAIRKRRDVEKPDMRYSKTADLLCEMGRFGQKTGAGWYDYVPGKRDADPEHGGDRDDREAPRRRSASRRARSATTRSCSGWCMRSSTKARRSSKKASPASATDIDMVYLTGYGFPLHRGGPMCYADTVGLFNVVQAMKRFAANPLRRRGVLAAGAAAGQAGGRRQELQLSRRDGMIKRVLLGLAGAGRCCWLLAVAVNTWRQGSRQIDVPPLAPIAVDEKAAARVARGGGAREDRFVPRRRQRSTPTSSSRCTRTCRRATRSCTRRSSARWSPA